MSVGLDLYILLKLKMKKIWHVLRKRWWLIVLSIVLVAFFLIRSSTQNSASKDVTYTVKRQNLKEELTFSGDIDATERTILRFQTSGMLSWVGVKEGDVVHKYQAVAALDQRELKKNLEKKLNAYAKERTDFDNEQGDFSENAQPSNKLLRQDVIDAYTKAQYDLNSSVLDVELSDIALKYSTLTSPIDGVVVRMGTKFAGVNVTPTQSEIEIVNPSTLFFSAAADQTEVVNLKSGQKTEITFDSYPDEHIPGYITEISYTPKEGETGTVYEVKIAIDTHDFGSKYRIGMTGDASFITKQKKDVLAVPTTFIKSDSTGKYVYVKENNTRVKHRISEGDTYDTMSEISSGLADGDVIVD